MNTNTLFLKPDEGKFLALAVIDCLEMIRESSKNQTYNWTPETRKMQKEMISAGESLRIKLMKLGFDMRDLPPFIEGDQDEFLTKQS
ncbi:MAG: hypothetical protein JST87_05345 [Bacteroidetes bacterium]|nr:hypothetical protein [Bacteroidota bacterium]